MNDQSFNPKPHGLQIKIKIQTRIKPKPPLKPAVKPAVKLPCEIEFQIHRQAVLHRQSRGQALRARQGARNARRRPSPRPRSNRPLPPPWKNLLKEKSALRESILARKAATKPIAFSLDEARAIAKTNAAKAAASRRQARARCRGQGAREAAARGQAGQAQPSRQGGLAGRHSRLQSQKGQPPTPWIRAGCAGEVPPLLQAPARSAPPADRGQLERHSEETLKRSSKDDAGDLSSYGQHMADAGTDTFDRDFALSMVSSEQEALSEIDAALKRIHDGTYGICEITGKPIPKERLLAVPFTRYSAEALKEIEKNRYRSRAQAGHLRRARRGSRQDDRRRWRRR